MIRLVIALWACVSGCVIAQTGPSPTWVKFPAGLTHVLIDAGERGEARIPIQRAPDSPLLAELDPRVVNVVTQQPRPSDLVRRFTLTFDAGDTKRGAALVVAVQPMLDHPGAYTVVAEIRSTQTPAADPQAFEVQLDRPAAQLAANSPLVIDQIWSWFSSSTVSAPALYLRERSQRSHLKPLMIEDRSEQPSPLHVTAAILEFPNVNGTLDLEPGGTVRLDAATPKRFPLGTTTGKLEISAPQLAEPVTVNYEVHARVHPGWLVVVSLLGFGFGYLVRIGLQVVQERAKGRIALLEISARLRKERAAQPDAEFRGAIDAALDTLDAELRQRDPAKLSAAAQAAATEFEAARSALSTRRQQLESDLLPLLALVQTRRPSPPSVAKLIAQSESELHAAEVLFKSGDVSGAHDVLEAMRMNVFQQMVEAARVWRRDATSYFDALVIANPPLLASAATQLQEAVRTWKDNLGTLPAPGAKLTNEALGTALDAAARSWSSAGDIAQQFAGWSAVAAEEVRIALGTQGLRQPQSLDRLNRETVAFASAIMADLREPADAAVNVTARVHALRQVWSDVLLSQVPPEKDLATVKAQLDQGEWLQAARAIAALLRPVQKPLGGSPTSEKASQAEPVAAPMLFRTIVAPPGAAVVPSPVLPRPVAEIETLRLSSLRELATAKILQTVLVALLLSFVAYALFAERFVGTPHDLLAIFFWAFGLDLSVDALVDAAKPLKPA